MEIFKEIKGFENYEVSNYGNVRSLKRNIVLRPSIVNGYLHVGLYKDGKHYDKYIHRLVAEAFIPNPNNLQEVNHKDENKFNNHVDNLEWCTHEYNLNYGTAIERMTEKLSKPIVAIDSEGNVVHEFLSAMEAGRNGFNFGHVSKCCRHIPNHNTHKGYQWHYKEEWEKIKNPM